MNWESLSVDFRLPGSGANGTLLIREFYSDFPEDVEFGVTVLSVGDGSDGDDNAVQDKVLGYQDRMRMILGRLVEGMMGVSSQAMARQQGEEGREGGGQIENGKCQENGSARSTSSDDAAAHSLQ